MAEMVGSALVQEAVSRGVSFALGKRQETASQGHMMERLEMAVNQLEFALERAQELRIWHISLISRRKQIKCAYVEAMELLDKHKQQQEMQVAHGVKKRKLWVLSANNMLTTSSFAGLSTDDVRRFELYADYAGKFVRDVESGCSLHQYNFCNPIVRRLLEGKTSLIYSLKQGNLGRYLMIDSTYYDERGVEAVLAYRYKNNTMAEKCFTLWLSLRLSESTDIVDLAIKGLHLLKAEFKHPVECAMAELTLLPNLQLEDISHLSEVVVDRQESMYQTIFSRPDPACCKGSRHGLCNKDNVSSGLADIFPEQVIFWAFKCYYVPSLESSTRSSFDEVGRGWKPLPQMSIIFWPHFMSIYYLMWWLEYHIDLKQSGRVKNNDENIYPLESIGLAIETIKSNAIKSNIQEVATTIKSNAISCFSRQPELREYRRKWYSEHGSALFIVENTSVETTAGVPRTRKRYNTRSSKKEDK